MTGFSGGGQCGAVRFHISGELGRASLCHCRMCQKAFGGCFGALVGAADGHLKWTRGNPDHFQSSNVVKRGFCKNCGTPLTFEHSHGVELAIGAFDEPEKIIPDIQVSTPNETISYFHTLHTLPHRNAKQQDAVADHLASVVSYQHPDHDTDNWTAKDCVTKGSE